MANARHSKAGRFVQQRLFAGLSTFGELEQRIADFQDEQRSRNHDTEFSRLTHDFNP